MQSLRILKIGRGFLFYPSTGELTLEALSDFIKRNDISLLPRGGVRDLDDVEITAISREWAKTLAKHWGCTLSSYSPSPADTTSEEWNAAHVREQNR